MKNLFIKCIVLIGLSFGTFAQELIPFNTSKWDIKAKSYILENYKGKKSIYLQGGTATLKDTKFLNGTIEFDIYLSNRQGFPGIFFRSVENGLNAENFYLRPHLSGKTDANQAAPIINGISPWQLYFGPSYSFVYNYNFDDWTHVKLVVNGKRAQIYLDNANEPNFSWNLTHPPREGEISIGGTFAPMHYANFKIDKNAKEILNFNPISPKSFEALINKWELSDKFEEKNLKEISSLKEVINSRKWGKYISIEEGKAANISREIVRYDDSSGNTVFAKIEIESSINQIKLFEFGYSDRVIVILNGKPVYKGTNRWRSRDYRYLGTIGLFDAVYLDLKKGKNTLLMAVSEDFGGWLVTGRIISDYSDNSIKIIQ